MIEGAITINILDLSVINCLNHVTQESQTFNTFVYHLSRNHLLKGAALSAAIWWLWFKPEPRQKEVRLTLISTLLASVIAVGIARFFAVFLPFSIRPILNKEVDYTVPYVDFKGIFDSASSLPSDHATLALTLALGIYFASKRLGKVMLFYAAVFILLPRVYLGLHYVTDILAGALIALLIVSITSTRWFSETISAKLLAFSESSPQTFYAILFLFTYETSNLYSNLRSIAKFTLNSLS